MCVHAYVSVGTCRGQQGALESLELELLEVVSCQMWVLETKLWNTEENKALLETKLWNSARA